MSLQDTNFTKNFVLKANGKKLSLDKPVVMGIINLSPISFFVNSQHTTIKSILKSAEKHIQEGAAIIDLGAISSKPGSVPDDSKTELKRLLPALKEVRENFPKTFISIDTFRSEVVNACADNGADIINDISSGDMDDKMMDFVAKTKLPYIMMHKKGDTLNMQIAPYYKSGPVKEVKSYLQKKIKLAREAGIKQIIIDPGFGFGKTVQHNFELLNGLKEFQKLHFPILVGISRKSIITKTLHVTAHDALNGTSVLNTCALLNGAKILRVHDVKAAHEAIILVNNLRN